MFDISIFKKYSKIMLKGRYKTAVLVVLFFYVFSFITLFAFNSVNLNVYGVTSGYSNFLTLLCFILMFFLELNRFCLSGFFLTMRNKTPSVIELNPEQETVNDFFERFSDWFAGLKYVLWKTLWLILWSFLFVIPAFVKAVAYSQMVYIVAENPDISVRKAMNISKVITRGYKGDLFLLYLSFIPWFFISFISYGAAGFYVIPYYEFTKINTYYFLKQKALKSGLLDEEDFGSGHTQFDGYGAFPGENNSGPENEGKTGTGEVDNSSVYRDSDGKETTEKDSNENNEDVRTEV